MKLFNLRQRLSRGFTLVGAMTALILWLLFLAGLAWLAWRMLNKLNHMFPPTPQDQCPTNIVLVTQPPPTYLYANTVLSNISSRCPTVEVIGQNSYVISFSTNCIDWYEVFSIQCSQEELKQSLYSIVFDDIVFDTNTCGFYKAEAYQPITNVTNDPML